MKVISVINKKGGCTKTTTCIHMAAYLAKRGNKILLIDFEAQRNLSIGYGIPEDYPYTVFDMLNGKAGLRLKNKKRNLYILAGSDMIDTEVYPLDILKKRLEVLEKMFKKEHDITFDYAIIDCSPSDLKNKYAKGKLQPKLNQIALYASDAFIVPLVHEKYAVDGLANFMYDAAAFKKEFNPSLKVGGVFFNIVEENTRRFKKYYQEVQDSVPDDYFLKTFVRKDVQIADATDEGESIFEVAPKSRSAKDYSKLCREILNKIN
ncbi:MAG: ParA family protein [Allomuricauda sp.]